MVYVILVSDGCQWICYIATTLIARFMGPTWGPSGADRTQVGAMLAPWTLLSGHPQSLVWVLDGEPLIPVKLLQTDCNTSPCFCSMSCWLVAWWRHPMETLSALLALFDRLVERSFDVFFDVHLTNSWTNNGVAGDLGCHVSHLTSIL